MNIGIDLDGCAFDFVQNFLYYLREINWFELNNYIDPGPDYMPSHWDFFTDFGVATEEFGDVMAEGIRDGYVFLDPKGFKDLPILGCTAVLRKFRRHGHTVHIVTHRSFRNGAVEQTVTWLKKYGIPFDALHFVQDKTVVEVDLLLEDSPENYIASVEAKIPCVLMAHKYNEHFASATRASSWHEFMELVEKINAKELHWDGYGFTDESFIGSVSWSQLSILAG